MKPNFYDKVAKKYGGYAFGTNKSKYFSEYPAGNPEKVFKDKLLELAGRKKMVLDVGCGDCKFAFQISNSFQEIVGVDTSKELLEIAKSKKSILKVINVSLSIQNAKYTTYKDGKFDIIYCRRGPSFYKEYSRLLKKSGYYLEIGIGEKDTIELKQLFGRGQGFGKWNDSVLLNNKLALKKAGFNITFAKDYFYNEYYFSYEDFNRFLQGVPIFEDFDSEKDKKSLQKYVNKFQTEKGIKLSRHRVVILAQKA